MEARLFRGSAGVDRIADRFEPNDEVAGFQTDVLSVERHVSKVPGANQDLALPSLAVSVTEASVVSNRKVTNAFGS
jgi:hypothetical protein